MEFFLGGVAACGAGFFTNPLEVVKTRMQLQGELKAKGLYTVHYRHVFHAFYQMAKVDGVRSLQNGLVPALWYQLCMNGFRLGLFQWIDNQGFIRDQNGSVIFHRSVIAGATCGCIGATIGSPVYLVKTHLQAKSASKIAVGHQHHYASMSSAFKEIYKRDGVKGLWRGVSGAVPRVSVGSASQLTTFSAAFDYVKSTKVFPPDSVWTALSASMISGTVVVACMTPFDVVSTRLYNQGVDTHGRGTLYSGILDCFVKIFRSEGLWGFYKGWGPSLFRLGPHTVLSLTFWKQLRIWYYPSGDT